MWILSVCLICESLHTAWGLNQNFDSSSEWKREWRFDGMEFIGCFSDLQLVMLFILKIREYSRVRDD